MSGVAVDAVKGSTDSSREFSLLEDTGQVEVQEDENTDAETRPTASCF